MEVAMEHSEERHTVAASANRAAQGDAKRANPGKEVFSTTFT